MSSLREWRVDRELLLDFFLSFSRFEFALKLAGFAEGNEKRVRPNWESYAASIKDIFDKSTDEDLLNASDYSLYNPPMKQVLLPNGLSWSTEVPNGDLTDIEKLLILVRRVRNNLFHGGKFDMESHEQAERTESLLRSCLIVLGACLDLSPNVKKPFNNAVI